MRTLCTIAALAAAADSTHLEASALPVHGSKLVVRFDLLKSRLASVHLGVGALAEQFVAQDVTILATFSYLQIYVVALAGALSPLACRLRHVVKAFFWRSLSETSHRLRSEDHLSKHFKHHHSV